MRRAAPDHAAQAYHRVEAPLGQRRRHDRQLNGPGDPHDDGSLHSARLSGVDRPLEMNATETADGVLRIAATAMSYAVKRVTTERGLDAGDFVLVAYGGAGPLHAVDVAREIGIRNVIIPGAPGVFSA